MTTTAPWATTTARSLCEAVSAGVVRPEATVAALAITATEADICTTPDGLRADALFELGSLTKTVTAKLLAMAVDDGLLRYDDPIGRWLDAGDNAGITLLQLVTHTSGLPKVAGAAAAARMSDPYRELTAERAEGQLRRVRLTEPGAYAYSNFGFQLLGLVLERASGASYGDLVNRQIGGRLGITELGIDLAGYRLPGHAGNEEVPRWQQPLAGAGAIETTVEGMARWLGTSLASPGPSARLGWTVHDDCTVSHTGETAGFSAAVSIDHRTGRALAILADQTALSLDLLEQLSARLAGSEHERTPQPLDPEWAKRAEAVAGLLIGERSADVWALMTAPLREKITVEMLSATWLVQSTAAGELTDCAATCRRRGRYVAADVTITGTSRSCRLALIFTPDGAIARLALLRPGQQPPW